ncbi:unnamed protein product [Durusdinium trenchii]|uniref:Uncharacterized protein n=1 Tax=Durusdinium trenchii TaxID=1381693 RepID=A0ABP0KX69_9DINO
MFAATINQGCLCIATSTFKTSTRLTSDRIESMRHLTLCHRAGVEHFPLANSQFERVVVGEKDCSSLGIHSFTSSSTINVTFANFSLALAAKDKWFDSLHWLHWAVVTWNTSSWPSVSMTGTGIL